MMKRGFFPWAIYSTCFSVELRESVMQSATMQQNAPDEQQPEGSKRPIADDPSTPDR